MDAIQRPENPANPFSQKNAKKYTRSAGYNL